MGLVIYLLYDALVSIQSDGNLILDFDFMMDILVPVKSELEKFDIYTDWYYYAKVGNVIGSHSNKEQVLLVDQGIAMLLFPQEVQKRQTSTLCAQLGAELATFLILEIEDPRKANCDYLSAKNEKHSYAQTSDTEKAGCMGLKAVNDPA